MADPQEPIFTDNLASLEEARSRLRQGSTTFGGGGGGPTDVMEQRVAALEKGFEKLDGKIDKLTELVRDFGLKTSERLSGIEGRLTGIEKVLDSKAAKGDLIPIEAKLGTVDGTVRNLPGTPTLITLVMAAVTLSLGGAAGLAFTLFKIFKP